MPLILPNTIANETPADGDKLQQNFASLQDWANQDAITSDGSTGMTAPLLLPGPPTQPNQAATKGYVDLAPAMLPGTVGPPIDGVIPNPLTGFMMTGGSVVGAVNAANAFDINLPGTGFPNGLLTFTAMAGDANAVIFYCVDHASSATSRSKLVLVLYQPSGLVVGVGNVVRVHYIAIGF